MWQGAWVGARAGTSPMGDSGRPREDGEPRSCWTSSFGEPVNHEPKGHGGWHVPDGSELSADGSTTEVGALGVPWIVAHVDAGKTSLTERILFETKVIDKIGRVDQGNTQTDSLDLEKRRGITIKASVVSFFVQDLKINLIDTPGHVDFSYEVSRSLQACEGAVLVVDASQGIQAQTLANVYLALEANLTIIPVLNKIDLPAADVPRVSAEIINLLGCDESDILKISAKTGEGIEAGMNWMVDVINTPPA